jgi:hypothetical protein
MDQARAFAADLEKNYPDYLPAKLMQLQITLNSGDQKGAVALATDLLARLDKTAPDRENSPQLLAEIREKTHLVRGSAQLQLRNTAAVRSDCLQQPGARFGRGEQTTGRHRLLRKRTQC